MSKNKKHIIIIGAGFGGLYAAKKLLKGNNDLHITIIDKRNFHLFQPLLYQVAAAQLSPEDIAYPVRTIFEKYKNVTVLKEKVTSVDLDKNCINVECGNLYYDKLIISVGVMPDYFGNENWKQAAPPLKTLEDALKIRGKVLNVFERAESEMLHPCDEYPLNFVIIGAGPTGIELSGALAELRKYTLKNEFRRIRPERAKIYLVEAGKTILPGFPEKLIKSAENSLAKLGITIRTNCFVTNIKNDQVEIRSNETTEIINSKVVLWAAGVKAKFKNSILSANENIEFDKKGRVM
ncbi:MAG: FAD-dependent oxidoreductase, partial [Chlorobi bacterium]|nr:FAD-dependent oxidoreductase [Chlorobiota bacterium]